MIKSSVKEGKKEEHWEEVCVYVCVCVSGGKETEGQAGADK